MSPNPAFWRRNGRAHCGTDIEGGYLYTLTLTDVATGWTECLPLLYRSQETVLAALQQARLLFPFPILGSDTGVLPSYQTTTQVNIVHPESKPFQIRWEAHIPNWNATASCYTRRR